jgi:hypothetical protein
MSDEPLTAALDNVLAWRLGEIAHAASKAPAGDLIDTGLILLRMLGEKGFSVYLSEPRGGQLE